VAGGERGGGQDKDTGERTARGEGGTGTPVSGWRGARMDRTRVVGKKDMILLVSK